MLVRLSFVVVHEKAASSVHSFLYCRELSWEQSQYTNALAVQVIRVLMKRVLMASL